MRDFGIFPSSRPWQAVEWGSERRPRHSSVRGEGFGGQGPQGGGQDHIADKIWFGTSILSTARALNFYRVKFGFFCFFVRFGKSNLYWRIEFYSYEVIDL